MTALISTSDLKLFTEAQQAVNQANAILQFVHNHMVNTYKIGPLDSADLSTGLIVRSLAVAPPTPTVVPDATVNITPDGEGADL